MNIKKFVLASAMVAVPLMAIEPIEMAIEPIESQPAKKRIEIAHPGVAPQNTFKFKKIHSAFAKTMLNWVGNLELLSFFVSAIVPSISAADDRPFNQYPTEERIALEKSFLRGMAMSALFAIGCKLASDKLFTRTKDEDESFGEEDQSQKITISLQPIQYRAS